MGSKYVNAPHSTNIKMETATHLTKRGIWDLRFIGNNTHVSDQNLVVQVTAVKLLEENTKFKAQYTLSDGVVCMTGIIMQS